MTLIDIKRATPEPVNGTLPPPPTSPLREVLATDRQLRRALLVIAFSRTATETDAYDVVGETFRRALARELGELRWDPAGRRTAHEHLVLIMKSVLKDRRRRLRRHPVLPLLPGHDPEGASDPLRRRHEPLSGWMSVEDQLIAHEEEIEQGRLEEALRARLAAETGGAVLLRMIDTAREGETRAEVAERFGCTAKEVKNARERIVHHAREVLKAAKKGDLS